MKQEEKGIGITLSPLYRAKIEKIRYINGIRISTKKTIEQLIDEKVKQWTTKK